MAKTILIVCLLSVLISCQQTNTNCPSTSSTNTQSKEEITVDQGCTPESTPLPQEGEDTAEPDVDVGDVPQEAALFDASIKFRKFEVEDEMKVYQAIDIIKKVINSLEFKQRVINFTYQGKKMFVDSNGLSNEEVYLKVLSGSEDLRPETDHEMDLDLQLYFSNRNTVGYTYRSGLRIWMNRKYFDVYSPAEVARNIFHEWTHKLGFRHASSYSESRNSSVPYALGYLIEELGKQYE